MKTLAAVLIISVMTGFGAEALNLKQTIPLPGVKGRFDHFAIDTKGQRLFAADLFYDANPKRIYISCGEGFIDVIDQSSPDKYQRIANIPTAAGARTAFSVPTSTAFTWRYPIAEPRKPKSESTGRSNLLQEPQVLMDPDPSGCGIGRMGKRTTFSRFWHCVFLHYSETGVSILQLRIILVDFIRMRP